MIVLRRSTTFIALGKVCKHWWSIPPVPAKDRVPNDRLLSSGSARADNSSQSTTMENKLRRLYKRVHPDLFSAFPNAQSQNEQSFQRLTEFLDTLKPSKLPTSSRTFPLIFFLKPLSDSELPEKEIDFQKVEITLRAGGSPRDKHMQLGKLFDSCGLGKDFTMDTDPSNNIKKDSIEAFLYEVAAEAAKRKGEANVVLQDVYACQHALHLRHSTKVSFDCGGITVEERLKALKQMLVPAVVDAAHGLRAGGPVRFIIADRYELDPQGRVRIARTGNASAWSDFIKSLQNQEIRDRQEYFRSVRDLEAFTARCVGLEFVHADEEMEGSLSHLSNYIHLLQSLISESRDRRLVGAVTRPPHGESGGGGGGRVGGSAGAGAVLLVRRELPAEVGLPAWGCGIEPRRGTLLAAVCCDIGKLLDLIQESEGEVARLRRVFLRQQEALTMCITQVQIGNCALFSHEQDSFVGYKPAAEALGACGRLMERSGSLYPPEGLSPLTQGACLSIGTAYDLRPDGTIVIPHDFHVS